MKKIKNYIIIIILLFIIYYILTNSKEIIKVVLFGFNIWKNNIFPSLFPFFVISSLLINYGFLDITSKLLSPFMEKVFKINKNTSFIFIMSILSGFPSNAKYTLDLLNKNIIDEKSATKILLFSHFSNPLFIIGTISIFLDSYKASILVLIIHYITNVIIGLIFRNCYISDVNINKQNKLSQNNFGGALKEAITSSIDTLLLVLGTICFFLIITTIINNYFNFNPYIKTIINGSLEMTQGLKYLSLTNFSLQVKSTLAVMFISFGGISVHMQVLSIISGSKIKYQPYLVARLFHASIAGILVFLLTNIS